jgi:hypothetical protein
VSSFFEQIPEEIRLITTVTAIVLLGVADIAQIIYVRYLRVQRYELVIGVRTSEQLLNAQKLELLAWADADRSFRGIDTFLATILEQKELSVAEKRWRAVQCIMVACRDNILPGISAHDKYLAFLEYSENKDLFSVVTRVPERLQSANHQLTRNRGLAGRAIQKPGPHYIADVDAPDAAAKGYIHTGTPEYKSIVCISVWIDDTALGVITAECLEKNKFTETDFQMLERFAHKIMLVYCIFPREMAIG